MTPAVTWGQGGAWEIEVHGGRLFTPDIPDGSRSVPPPGSSFLALSGFQSRRVSSWYFGDARSC
jgi:hypothetical protein